MTIFKAQPKPGTTGNIVSLAPATGSPAGQGEAECPSMSTIKPLLKKSWVFPPIYVARYDGGIAKAPGLKALREMVGSPQSSALTGGSQVVGQPTVKTNLNYFHVTFDPYGVGRAQRIHSNGTARTVQTEDAAVCDQVLIEIGAKKAQKMEGTHA